MATEGGSSPSEARSLSLSEQQEMRETARCLPDDWVLLLMPFSHQLSMQPQRHARYHRYEWAASPSGKVGRLLYGRL